MSIIQKKDYITFASGINTEANVVKDEEGSCKELINFKINKDGSLEKRGGFLLEQELSSVLLDGVNDVYKPQYFLWKDVGGNNERDIYVVKQGFVIKFYDAKIGIKDEGLYGHGVNLSGYTSPGYTTGDDVNIRFTSGDGYLFITGKYINPIIVKYNDNTERFVVSKINIKIRDYIGEGNENEAPEYYPSEYNSVTVYNASNQGFTENQISEFYSRVGYMPSKSDNPNHFKYLKISTDDENIVNPKEVYDYALTIENNNGTTVAPNGKYIIDVFNTEKKIGGSKLIISPNVNNIIGFRCDATAATVTMELKRIPEIPLNTYLPLEVLEQNNFRIDFPQELAGHGNYFGHPYSSDMSPFYVKWDGYIAEGTPIFDDNVDVNWDAYDGMTEAEYFSHSFRTNSVIVARNTGTLNEYVMVAKTTIQEDLFKDNLIDGIGGTMESEFVLPSEWNLPDNERGLYMRATTDAATDNLFYKRGLSLSNDSNSSSVYTYTNNVGDILTFSKIRIDSRLRPSQYSPHNNNYTMRFLNDNFIEISFNAAFEDMDEEDDHSNFGSYRWNSRDESGGKIFYLENILNSIKFKYTVSEEGRFVVQKQLDNRPECISFYANRVFYSGLKSEEFHNHIFYSQMGELSNNSGECYTYNDPTSEYLNSSLDTDGGYINIPEANNILNLVNIKDKLLVLARNTIHVIGGEPYFTATNHYVKKLIDIGTVSADAHAVVGNTIVFASDDGLYSVNINELNGSLTAQNFTNNKLKTLYTNLSKEQKENIKMNYNPYEKKLEILLNTDDNFTPDTYDTIINYDFDLESFYIYKIDQLENYKIVDFFEENEYNKNRKNSLLTYNTISSDYGIMIESSDIFKDFTIENNSFPCSLETNFINYDDIMRSKHVSSLFVYADNTIEDSHCEAFIKYDSSILGSSKWSKAEDIFRLQDKKQNKDVIISRQKCRGNGLFFKVKLENNEDKPCKIFGWTIVTQAKQQI